MLRQMLHSQMGPQQSYSMLDNRTLELLRVIGDVLEPSNRLQSTSYDSKTPLIGMVDSIPVESAVVRHFEYMLDKYFAFETTLDDKKLYREFIMAALINWKGVSELFRKLVMAKNKDDQLTKELLEVRDLASCISVLAEISLEAFQRVENKQIVSAEWLFEGRNLVRQNMQPIHHVHIQMAKLAKKLVEMTTDIGFEF